MSLIKSFKVYCLTEVQSPLTHMQGISGNEAILNSEKIVYKNTIRTVPVISGNALRHSLIREPGAFAIIENCNLKGKLTIDQANFLFYGGNLTESSVTENLKKIYDMQQLFPFIRLLGGSLRNLIIGGSLKVLRGILVCEENKERINKMLPDDFKFTDQLMNSQEFINNYQYTRGDINKKDDFKDIVQVKENKKDKKEKSNLMIYNGQAILSGTLFHHGFIMHTTSELEIGALFYSLEIWNNKYETIGGYTRIGHGKIKIYFILDDFSEDFIRDCILKYTKHLEEKKEKMIEWLNENFPEK